MNDLSQLGAPIVRSGQKAGRGQYLEVVAPSSAPLTVPHTLGRIPQMLLLLDSGNAAYPGFTWPIAGRTAASIQMSFTVAGTYWIWLN